MLQIFIFKDSELIEGEANTIAPVLTRFMRGKRCDGMFLMNIPSPSVGKLCLGRNYIDQSFNVVDMTCFNSNMNIDGSICDLHFGKPHYFILHGIDSHT